MTTYGSVCSGIEAATVAWHPLGWRAEWLAEIEPFPSAVLAHHYPDVPNLGDMTKLAAKVLAGKIAAPDVLVGGTPCQAFSVAGMREGLADPRGALTIKYVELADATDLIRTRRGEPEAVIVWENVPGVLSDKGNAFGCFLGALAGEDCELQPSGKRWADAGCVYGPKRTIAWRILDAQYFGLAQRRRVFVVASARAGFDPVAVLFEREGVRRDTAPGRGEGKNTAGTTGQCAAFGGNNTSGPIDVAPARNACASGSGRMDFESEAFIVHGTQDPCVSSDTAFALGRNSGQENAVFAIQAGALRTNPLSGPDGVGIQADHAYTLEARAEVQAVCVTGDITHTLKADGFDGSEDGTGRGQPIVAAFHENQRAELTLNDIAGTVKCAGGKPGQGYPAAMVGSAVRRLTPRECERLQGFTDDYTLIPWRGKPDDECPDGPRYKAIGNSKAVPVVRWIGRRIQHAIA